MPVLGLALAAGWLSGEAQPAGRTRVEPSAAPPAQRAPAKPPASAASAGAAAAVPKTERMRVATRRTPILVEVGADEDAVGMLDPGDLVLPGEVVRSLDWHGLHRAEGTKLERSGEVIAIRLAPGGGTFFAFSADFGEPIEVPSAAVLCESLTVAPSAPSAPSLFPCPQHLRRLKTVAGRLAMYAPCYQGPCPVAVMHDGLVRAVTVDGLSDARPFGIGGGTVLVATSGFVRAEGHWSGADLVAIALDGPLPIRGGVLEIGRTDNRHATEVHSRSTMVRFADDSVCLDGAVKVVVRDTGRVRTSRPLHACYRIGADASFTPLAPAKPAP